MTALRSAVRRDAVRFLDSNASLLVLLLANFFLLELVQDARWGALGSTLLSALALLVAISDPESGHRISKRHWLQVGACVALAPFVLVVNSTSLVGLTYLLPAGLLVTATLPVTLRRILEHRRITHETVLGALCAYVLVGLLFAFLYLAVNEFRSEPFFAQPGAHAQSEYLYFSFVALTTLGFGDLSPSVGLPQALTVLEALLGQVFLVTLVARLVTLWVRQSEALDDPAERDTLGDVEAALGRLEADVERALMDVSVLAYALDRDGLVVWQNHAHRRVIGDAGGMHFSEFVAPEDRRRATEAFLSKIAGNVRSTQYAVEVRAKAGPLHFEVTSVPLVRDDEVVGVLVLVASPPVPVGSPRVRLTPRQRDVLELLARGSTTEQISNELHIARETARNHIRAVLRALGVHSRVEAIAAARAVGLLDDVALTSR